MEQRCGVEEQQRSLPGEAMPERSTEAEADLVRAARANPRAFGVLYDRYVEAVYRYLYRQTGSREVAEDLTSLTFLRVLATLDRFTPGRPVAPWLLRIAHNALVDHRRSSARSMRLSEEMAQTLLAASDPATENLEQAEAFLSFTAGLPDDQRDALALRFIADLSMAQTAAVLGRSVGATKMLVTRALAALRTRIDRAGGEGPR